ncbi:MAG: polysaccharide biosynthesis protein [Clostridia bacterium]|nr:polysaccharide biosynthesis protein [Clostridia bacterium]
MSLKILQNRYGRTVVLAAFDIACLLCVSAVFYALTVLLGASMPDIVFSHYAIGFLLYFVCFFAVRILTKTYGTVWRYTSTKAYFLLIASDFIAGCIALVLFILLRVRDVIWCYFIVVCLTTLLSLTGRLVYRLWYKRSNTKALQKGNVINVAIAGAGQLGVYLLHELQCNPKSKYNPVLFIDKDPLKIGNSIAEVPVVSERDVEDAVEKYDIKEIIIAIGRLNGDEANTLYQYYAQTGCKVKVYDEPLSDSGNGNKRIVRDFQIEELLFRTPLQINDVTARNYYANKTVLVTGGGGSIGSEICRQLARCNPKKLIIVDIYENNAYEIQQELKRKYGAGLDLSVEIASVRDRTRIECIFKNYTPDIVFHAAAHKHVPFMESCGCEAIKNNVVGTYNTADMAEKYGVEKFILISTDKAVNPTNIMGASKRLCEMVVQCRTDSKTNFAAVRFGNVLGSNGSVIPLFKKQIAAGGPVTITDKRIIRYFMTIPEASQLVMQAGAMAKKGELFVLDMGKPVKIYDLAVSMIKLCGYQPDEDIEIREIGLRPGEKLYEELLMTTESLHKTDNDMIFIEKDTPLTRAQMEENLSSLLSVIEETKMSLISAALKKEIKRIVPTFKDPDEVNSVAGESDEMRKVANA